MKPLIFPVALIVMIFIPRCASIEAFNGHLEQSTDSGHFKKNTITKSTLSAEWPKPNVLNDLTAMNRGLKLVKETSVDIKAVRHFRRNYADIIDYKWYKTEAGYLSLIALNGKEKRIIYNHRGLWQYNFSSYGENKMLFEIRHLVKSNYYDNEILIVRQYDFEPQSIFFIKTMAPDSNIVTLRVIDGKLDTSSNKIVISRNDF